MEKPELKCSFGVLSRPDGSTIFCEGKTSILAGIYGPVEVKLQKAHIDKACVECYFRPKTGLLGVQDRLRESLIRNICEASLAVSLYPRTAVLVNLQEMQNSGQLISCAVNAVCLACLDAGIDMKFLFGAVSCFLNGQGDFCFLPPINEDSIKALFVFVFNNTTGSILASHTEGCFSTVQFEKALSLCRDESVNVFKFFKHSLVH
ncbi:exosome complex component RRP46 [Cylas formicarius]|uniref:exosome complex component RRP46 n=1 Tax=Cylas formicarius TaxID=197179 RepID=UPI002958C8CE|nr:exosome complex component RRP46 [Cylas formicarius]